MQDDPERNVIRFMDLFRSNQRSYGTWLSKNKIDADGRASTIRGSVPQEAFRSHLEGALGLGLVPILDDNTCWWGAIDVDTHGPAGRDFDLLQLAAKVEEFKFPLMVCRSKSGGAHLYLFLSAPCPVALVKPQLGRWAKVLGWPSAEVFPKQVSLDVPLGGREQPLGNWINLPYFNAGSTGRYCVIGGREASLEYFLEVAESSRHTFSPSEMSGETGEYKSGPPCLQEMIKGRIDEGSRNNAVFQAAVFLKRAYPDDWKPRVNEFNAMALAKPLLVRELRQITSSVGRKDYNYKCREEPCRSFCNRELCRTRDFGITDGDTKANELPPFDKIEKVIATPVRWIIHIQQRTIELPTNQLFDFNAVRQAVFEKLNLLLPRMKSDEWDVHLREIGEGAKIRHETTVEDIIFVKLCEFLRRARMDKMLPEDERRQALLRHMPALISISDTRFASRGQVDERGLLTEVGRIWYFAFRGQDFIDHMRRHKMLMVQEHAVHTILHRLFEEVEEGAALRDRFRIGERTLRNVWLIPEVVVDNESVPAKEFKSEY